jgi:hypothetical protein
MGPTAKPNSTERLVNLGGLQYLFSFCLTAAVSPKGIGGRCGNSPLL